MASPSDTASLGSASASENETVNTNNQAFALGGYVVPTNSNANLAPTVPEIPVASGVVMDSRRNAHIESSTELHIGSTEAASASHVTNASRRATDMEGSNSYSTEENERHADKEHRTATAQGEAYGRQAQSAMTETQGKQSMVITLKVRWPLNAAESQERGNVVETKHQNPNKANEEKPEDTQSSTTPQAVNSSTRTMITRSLAATAPSLVLSEAESSTARAPRPRPRPEKKRRTEDFDEEPRHKYKRLKR